MAGLTLGNKVPSSALTKLSHSLGIDVEEFVGVRKALPRFKAAEKAVVILGPLRSMVDEVTGVKKQLGRNRIKLM